MPSRTPSPRATGPPSTSSTRRSTQSMWRGNASMHSISPPGSGPNSRRSRCDRIITSTSTLLRLPPSEGSCTWQRKPPFWNSTWTRKSGCSERIPSSAYSRGAAVSLDGYLYLLGGAYLQRFDPRTDQWEIRRGMPTDRRSVTMTALDGLIYVIGGSNSGGATAAVEAYDPATDAWMEKAPLPDPRRYHGCTTLQGRILALGGVVRTESAGEELSASVVVYDPAADRWEVASSLAQARRFPGVVTMGEAVVCAGAAHRTGTSAPWKGAPCNDQDPVAFLLPCRSDRSRSGRGVAGVLQFRRRRTECRSRDRHPVRRVRQFGGNSFAV